METVWNRSTTAEITSITWKPVGHYPYQEFQRTPSSSSAALALPQAINPAHCGYYTTSDLFDERVDAGILQLLHDFVRIFFHGEGTALDHVVLL